jgi:NRAMP (natural resistance-associated macrophage protein)-like metal ion transporter
MAYLDPGNLAGDLTAGISGRYSLLWVLLLSTILGYYFQTFALQLGVVTGKDLATLCRETIPRTSRILLWLMT